MTTLGKALEMAPWRLLVLIGRQRGLPISSNTIKADLVDWLSWALLDSTNLNATIADLAKPEQQALADVLAAGGRSPLRHLRPRHGDLRSVQWLYRWSSRARQQTSSNDLALTPLEGLYILGLVFYDAATDDVFIPVDLVPHLPAPDLPPPPTTEVRPAPALADLLCHDLAVLLALLRREDVRPLTGGWLPPRFLATWGQRCAVPPASPQARSELRTARRRFLHYLAETAGLIAYSGPFLKPAPASWLWLKAPRADRLETLWKAWAAPDADCWCAFRLPGDGWLELPAVLVAAIHARLSEMAPCDPNAFAQALVARQPGLRDLTPVGAFDADALLVEAVVELLTGPLVWLGLLQGEYGVESRKYEAGSLCLAPQGSAWLAGDPLPASDAPPPARFSVTADLQPDPLDSTLTFTLAEGLPEPAHLAILVEVGSKECGVRSKETPSTSYSLLPTSFAHALHRGWSAPALLDALDELTDRPLTGQEKASLHAWAEAAERAVIRRPTVLETTAPGVISRLASTRRGRSLIVRTLSPRAVVVDEGRLNQLIRRLTRQEGVPPRVELPPSPTPSAGDGPTELGRSGAAHAWLALRVYQGLGELVRLPARTPQALLEHLAALADPADPSTGSGRALSAAETAAQATLDALQEVVDGYSPFPSWPDTGLPVEESLAVIEGALAEGRAVEMEYYTAGRDTLTHRVVEPYRLEWRGDVGYLVGFCHRAQSERTFRLDRISSIVKVQLSGSRDDE
jgi:hypothetical protein